MTLGLRIPIGARVVPTAGAVRLTLTDNDGAKMTRPLTGGEAMDLAAALTRASHHPDVKRGTRA